MNKLKFRKAVVIGVDEVASIMTENFKQFSLPKTYITEDGLGFNLEKGDGLYIHSEDNVTTIVTEENPVTFEHGVVEFTKGDDGLVITKVQVLQRIDLEQWN